MNDKKSFSYINNLIKIMLYDKQTSPMMTSDSAAISLSNHNTLTLTPLKKLHSKLPLVVTNPLEVLLYFYLCTKLFELNKHV